MKSNSRMNRFIQSPFWKYLNQPVFSSTQPLILNPKKFNQSYKLERLEKCWEQDYIKILERCWHQTDNLFLRRKQGGGSL